MGRISPDRFEKLVNTRTNYTYIRYIGGGKGDVAAVIKKKSKEEKQTALKIDEKDKEEKQFAFKLHGKVDPEGLEDAIREIKALIEFNSDYLVDIFDYGQIDNHPFVVMEKGDMSLEDVLLELSGEGESHREEVARVGEGDKLKEEFVFECVEDILNGLDYLESKEKIHRDIKPNNIIVFFKEDGIRCKLADFEEIKSLAPGAAKTRTQTRGTDTHMAPEQTTKYCKEDEPDYSADVYSVGIILYQLLTGTTSEDLPLLDRTKLEEKEGCDADKGYIELKESPEELYLYLDLGGKISNMFFKEIIKKALRFDKDKPGHRADGRYQHAKEFLEDLRVARKNQEYEAIKGFMRTDITNPNADKDRKKARDKWKNVFSTLYGSDQDYSRRRNRNWLLNKFEDEVIAKKVRSDLGRIDRFYQKVSKPEVKKKIKGITYLMGISIALKKYAAIWEVYSDLMQGRKGEVQTQFSVSVGGLGSLADEYNPSKRIDEICGTEEKPGIEVENEDIANKVEAELNQIKAQIDEEAADPEFDEFKAIIPDAETLVTGLKSKIQGKLDEITTYRKKAGEVCADAKEKYRGALTPGKVNPAALDNALKVFEGEDYQECSRFYQVAAAKAELMYLDAMVRKMCGVTTDRIIELIRDEGNGLNDNEKARAYAEDELARKVEELKTAAGRELAKIPQEREYSCASAARDLAEKDKISFEDFEEMKKQQGIDYFGKKDYENALSCFEQLDQKDPEVAGLMGATLSNIGNRKKGEEQIEFYELALKYADKAVSRRAAQEDYELQNRISRNLERARNPGKTDSETAAEKRLADFFGE
jgi:serine/threonine protein kinase